MNERLVKKLRTIAFNNTPSSDERIARRWVVLEDRKHHRMLRCLDPRASYQAIKKNFKNGTVVQKKIMRQEIDSIFESVKKKFPHGIVFGDNRTFLGQKLPEIGGENAPR
jgi:hypothetical protein